MQSDQSLCYSSEYSITVKVATEPHLEFLSLNGGCKSSSESTLVKMPHCLLFVVGNHMSLLNKEKMLNRLKQNTLYIPCVNLFAW